MKVLNWICSTALFKGFVIITSIFLIIFLSVSFMMMIEAIWNNNYEKLYILIELPFNQLFVIWLLGGMMFSLLATRKN